MNNKVNGLILICFIFLSGCFSAMQDTSKPPKHGINSDDSVKTDLTFAGNQPKVSQEAGKPSVSILDLYGNWNGDLICTDQSYTPGSTIYYSEEYVECEIRLNFEIGLNTTTDDLRILEEKYISVEDELTKKSKERFDYIDFYASADHPNLIKFRIQLSRQPLKIIFKSKTDHKPIAFNFEYAEPLTYTISRPFEADGKIYDTGVRQYLQTGASHIYNISFSRAVDKDSVEQMVNQQLQGLNKEIKWLSEHSLTLTLQLKKNDLADDYEEYRLNLTAVKTQKGLVNNDWQSNQTMRFQPANMKRFFKNNLLDRSERLLFNSLIAYSSLNLSPNGKWILAEELSSSQSVFITNYSLLDLNGKRLKELGMQSPIWLPDGSSLLYADHNSVMRYEIPTGENHVIWSDPRETAIMSFEYDRASGRLLVAAGHSDDIGGVPIDLSLFNSVNDGNPRLIKEVLSNLDEEAWNGLHYTLPVHFIDSGLLYLEKPLPPDEKRSEYQKVRSIMDWKSGKSRSLDMKGELYPLIGGKMLHEVNGKWSVYDVVSDKETPINFNIGNGEWLQIKAIQKRKVILSVTNVKHFLLDLNTMSLQRIPGSLHILSNSAWNGDVFTVE